MQQKFDEMISIVIPTYNRPELLAKCLDSLLYRIQGLSEVDYEVIISDDSPNELTKNFIQNEYPLFKFNAGPRRGPAANRNFGASKATGRWIMFIDDDCIPDHNIVKNYLEAIAENPTIQVFEGCIMADRPKRHFLEESPINITGGYLWSCNFLINRDIFISELKGFDENFPFAAMEDVDVDFRLKEAGHKIIFVSNAIVIHPWRLQPDMANMVMKRIESEKYFLKKHPKFLVKDTAWTKFKIKIKFCHRLFIEIIKFKGRGLITYLKVQRIINDYKNNRGREGLL